MKVLAIRGKNLASLASEFEVDFQAEPLASAGLFAITGPTGAGKSTLLDALCLALYDETPRLKKASVRNSEVPDAAGLSIAQHDPRTTLRRGSAEGFAEVDFVGNDGRSCRARWTVRRARNRADGKLQNSEISLESLPDRQPLGDRRKSETLKLIERKIGLSFDQFTRAVLLAQNDFATFLKADDDVRAELLQTLTGTETFAHISKSAFARMREEKETLQRLEEQRNTLAPLAPEVRAGKEANFKLRVDELAALEKTRAETESWLRWFEALAKLKSVEAEAGAKRDQARTTQVSALPRGLALARIEQVQPARALLDELTRLADEIRSLGKIIGERQNDVALATKNLALRTAECEATGKRVALAEAEKARTAPHIETARSLDARLVALTPPFEQAVLARDNADKAQRDAAEKLAGAKAALAHTQNALATSERWLAEHHEQKALAEGWPAWEATFAHALAQNADKETLLREIAGITRHATEQAEALAKAQSACAARTQEHGDAEQKLAALTTVWKAFDSDAMARRKQQLETRREQLVEGETRWSAWEGLQPRMAQANAQKHSHIAARDKSAQCLEALAQKKPGLEQARDAATRAYELARLAAGKDARSLRASLQAEQPCPVCGAREHPYAEAHPAPVDAILKALKDDQDERQRALTSLLEATATHLTEHKQALTQIVLIDRELAQLEASITEHRRHWSNLAIAPEAEAVSEALRGDWFAEQQSRLKTGLAELNQKEDRYRQASKEKEEAQGVLNQHKTAFEAAKKSLTELETGQKTSQQACASAQLRLQQIETQLEGTLDKLDKAFVDGSWRKAWLSGPESFIEQCRGDAQRWLQQHQQRTELSALIAPRKATEAALSEACAKTAADLKMATAQLQRQAAELDALRAQRLSVLDGKPVKNVEKSLEQACAEARAHQTRTQDLQQQAELERTRRDEAWRHAVALLAKHQDAHGNANVRLEAWLTDFNASSGDQPLALDRLRQLLAFEPAGIALERKTLQGIDQAVESSTAVARAQQEAREAHEKTRPTELGEEDLKASVTKVRAEITATSEVSATLRAEILADDERQKQARGLLDTIATQEKTTHLWCQLGDLIGSADGKKFRNFAQQLTLDILLGYANRHLQTLSRRYRLERIKDSLGLLVIDQDMGDELRSVHSLSGGESFLLSLALALGLASLSSHRVRVESLFIDEGFGSLDSDSLRVAMDALDTLQAQGRKVGVISHVQEMNERIGVRIEVNRQSGGQSRVRVM